MRIVSRRLAALIADRATWTQVYTLIPMRERVRRAWRDKKLCQLTRMHDVRSIDPNEGGPYGLRITTYASDPAAIITEPTNQETP